MLQCHWRLVCLTIFVFATPSALLAQDSQYEGSAESGDLAIIGATLIDGNGGAPRVGTTGLTPGEALGAATKRAAEMLNADDEFGTIEPGKRADVLILGANPLDDTRNTRSLETVIAEGRVVDRDALEVRIP